MNSMLNKYSPLKKVIKYKLKFKTKPWISSSCQKPLYIKKLFKKFVNKKYP